jgi:hypothetical protein
MQKLTKLIASKSSLYILLDSIWYPQKYNNTYVMFTTLRYNTAANVVNNLKNDSSYKFIGEVILKINVV